jgi:hypothetical protein
LRCCCTGECFRRQEDRTGLVADLRGHVIEMIENFRANTGTGECGGNQRLFAARGKKNENGSAGFLSRRLRRGSLLRAGRRFCCGAA